jgi:hypothetical protein
MPTFSNYQQSAFAGIIFPWKKYSVKCGIRDHVHEYPHTPGGKPEKMGRKLYEVEFSGLAMDSAIDPKWRDLWPGKLRELRAIFEQELTKPLVIPTIGTIQAYCVDWGQDADAALRNGETFTWRFREDDPELWKLEKLITVGPSSIQAQAEAIKVTAEKHGFLEDIAEFFAVLEGAVNDVLAVRDTAMMYSSLVESKIHYLTYLCEEADRTLDVFKDPESWPILEALKQLWASSKELAENFTEDAGTLRTYTLPTEMNVSQVSMAVYSGDGTRGTDILSLNPIENAFEIPAGTQIRYMVEAA